MEGKLHYTNRPTDRVLVLYVPLSMINNLRVCKISNRTSNHPSRLGDSGLKQKKRKSFIDSNNRRRFDSYVKPSLYSFTWNCLHGRLNQTFFTFPNSKSTLKLRTPRCSVLLVQSERGSLGTVSRSHLYQRVGQRISRQHKTF